MSQYVDGNVAGRFVASAAIAQYARVKISGAGTVATAGLAEKEIGTALNKAFAAGDAVQVKLRTAAGTHKMVAIEALAVGAPVYTETDGKVQDTAQATAFLIGTALEAATNDGDVIEVLYNAHGDTANE
jgi:predicted RecA/RadA family phage recombinase